MQRPHAAFLVVLYCTLWAPGARADPSGEETTDPAALAELREEAPSQVPAFLEAARLAETHPHKSLSLYAEVSRNTKRFSEASRRACLLARLAETRDPAITLCETAVARKRSPENLVALATMLATKVGGQPHRESRARALSAEANTEADTPWTRAQLCVVEANLAFAKGESCLRALPAEAVDGRRLALEELVRVAMTESLTADAERLSAELTALAPDSEQGWNAVASLAVTRRDAPTVGRAAAQLRRLRPAGPRGPYMQSMAYELEGRKDAAERTLVEAERAGLSRWESLLTRARRDASATPLWRMGVCAVAAVVGAWTLLVAAALAVNEALSRRLLRDVADGRPLPRKTELRPVDHRVRRLYGGALWFLTALCDVPLWAMVACGCFVGGIWLPWAMVWTWVLHGTFGAAGLLASGLPLGVMLGLLIRYAKPPSLPSLGLPLSLQEHTVLASILDEVAEAVGTPRIEHVFLVPDDALAVVARGTLWTLLRGRAEPCLTVGAGTLRKLDVQAFRALLAQEHGHIASDEIPGATLALAVRERLRLEARARRQRRVVDPVQPFVEGAERLFRRVSHAAARFQELRGDRIAVAIYGFAAFERGLRLMADPMSPEGVGPPPPRPIADPYREKPPRPRAAEVVAWSTAGPDGSRDGHPSLPERLARAKHTRRREGAVDSEGDALRPAWRVLSNRLELNKQLAAVVAARIS